MGKSKGIQGASPACTLLENLSFFKSKFCLTREIQEVSGHESHQKSGVFVLSFDVCACVAVLKDCKLGKGKGCSQQKALYTVPSQPLKISLKMNQSLYYSESPQGAWLMIEHCVCTS